MGNFFNYSKNANSFNNQSNQQIKIIQHKPNYQNNFTKNNQLNLNLDYDNNYKKYKISINQELQFKNSFNEIIDEKTINKFRFHNKIIFGFSFNQDVKNKFTSNILFIQFGHNFNKPISCMVVEEEEDNIEEIILDVRFNQNVNNLSQKLKKISFGYAFNFPVDNLPNNIEFIKFGNNFNQNIDNLPCSLICVIFGVNFNYNIDNLPSSVKYIEIGEKFAKEINNLPFDLKKIKLNKKFFDVNKEHLTKILCSNDFVEITY